MPTDYQLGFLRIMAIVGVGVAVFMVAIVAKPLLLKAISPVSRRSYMVRLSKWIAIALMLVFWVGLAVIAYGIVLTSSHRLNNPTRFCLVYGATACGVMAVWGIGKGIND